MERLKIKHDLSFKSIIVILITVCLIWGFTFYSPFNKSERPYYYIFENLYITLWIIAFWGFIPILFLEFILRKGKVFYIHNLYFYGSLIVFDLNYFFNRNLDWIMD